MPISRKRRPRPSIHKPRRAARARSAFHVSSVSLRDLVAQGGPDEHDLRCITRAVEAGARGDVQASLNCELAGTVFPESPHRFILQDLIDQGASAPAWAYSRWCMDLAYRSMLLACDARTDEAVRYVMVALYPDALARALEDPTEIGLLGTRLAASDHLVQDIALHELGGFVDFLDDRAQPGLLDRMDRVRDWVGAPVGAYEFLDIRGCRLVLRDLVDDREVAALNIGAASGGIDEALIGRLVPITPEPGLMFASRPMTVDLPTARTVAEAVRTREPLAWLSALMSALDDGRVTQGFHHTPSTLLTSDLPVPRIAVGRDATSADEAGRFKELRARGYSAAVANAIAVLEVGLIAAGVSDRAAAATAPHVAVALGTHGAFEAAMVECRGPETPDRWRVLAAVVPDHLVERCRVLAGDDRTVT